MMFAEWSSDSFQWILQRIAVTARGPSVSFIGRKGRKVASH